VLSRPLFFSLNVQMGFLSSTYIASNVKKRLHILWVVRFMGTSIKQSSPDTRHGGAWGGRGGIAPTHLGTGWGWVVSVAPLSRFAQREGVRDTHCTGGWVGFRAGLDTEVRGKILCSYRGSNPDRPVIQSVVRHYADWNTPAPGHIYMKPNLWKG
jgi:hypothetical protein